MKQRKGPPVILNVDDDEPGRYVVNRQLQRAGYETIDAATGEEALRLAESRCPDLILLDVRLPDIDGFEVCRRIRANPEIAGIPVLQMSASYRDISSKVKGLENGADGYLTEPTEPAFLAATINSLLRMKSAEQRVTQAARQWKTTFDAVQDGIAFLDSNGAVLQSNDAYSAIAKSEPERLSSLTQELIGRLLSTRERIVTEETLGDRVLSIAMDRVLDDANELSGAVCTIADITARKQFELQMRHTQKLESIGLLAGGIAHDFNNLLVGIMGGASYALDTISPSHSSYALLQGVVEASERAAHLTRQMLAYAGKGRLIVEAIDLSDMVVHTAELISASIPKSVQVKLHLEEHLPTVQTDAGQMQQVVMNLIINAAEAIENKNGLVVVRTRSEEIAAGGSRRDDSGNSLAGGLYAVLEVEDTGCGIDPSIREKIFDPFFTTKFTGRGLGLAAVSGIVRSHHGAIEVETMPGRGSTFRVLLPASQNHVVSAQPGPYTEAASRGAETILVIDDEAVVRNLAEAALGKSGYRAIVADGGPQGLEYIRNNYGISLVLLDVSMPEMSGPEVLEALYAIRPTLPVIICSGYSEDEIRRQFSGLEMAGILQKPFTTARLIAKIRSVLDSVLASRHSKT